MLFIKNFFRKQRAPSSLDKKMAIPVLCYHGSQIGGLEYSLNDHVAMKEDLCCLARLKYRLLSPLALALALHQQNNALLNERLACITFDDGTDFDYHDQHHSNAGLVESFHHILSECPLRKSLVGDGPLSVAFVIASKAARQQIDQACLLGQDQIKDSWWRECAMKKIIGIGNHSWDHTHETLDVVSQVDNIKGSFHAINTYKDADQQIRAAQDYIDQKSEGNATPLFAYPYGHASDYLVQEYFPNYEKEHRQIAAFGTTGAAVTCATNRWDIPRFVFGHHWRTPEEFEKLLRNLE